MPPSGGRPVTPEPAQEGCQRGEPASGAAAHNTRIRGSGKRTDGGQWRADGRRHGEEGAGRPKHRAATTSARLCRPGAIDVDSRRFRGASVAPFVCFTAGRRIGRGLHLLHGRHCTDDALVVCNRSRRCSPCWRLTADLVSLQ
nr:unnamed protein product [Digitaria exilis]